MNDKKQILLLGMSSYPGGTETYIKNIFLNESFSQRANITFVCYEDKMAYEDEVKSLGYKVLYVASPKRRPSAYCKAISAELKNCKYDAVYINALNASNPFALLPIRKHKIKTVAVHSHCNKIINFGPKYMLHLLFKGLFGRSATLKLACSKDAAKWMFGRKAGEATVIPNAINPYKYSYSEAEREAHRAKYGIAKGELCLGSVGRFGAEKNNIFMLKILEGLLSKGINAKLLLVGDGPKRQEIEAYADEKKLTDRVVLAGTVIDPYKVYSAFDIFLFPSVFEGFGISALEAQSCGLKCLCSDRLSEKLNVTGTLTYLPIDKGEEPWCDFIAKYNEKTDRAKMNEDIRLSEYNIEKQIKNIMELINV